MILSFHPNIVAHENIQCAGRLPNKQDEAAIARAEAIIVSQGCGERLYRLCRKHCAHVFPNYDVRYDFPGKTGQARLFQKLGVPSPRTIVFETVSSYRQWSLQGSDNYPGFPCVLKLDRGGEGEGVFLVEDATVLETALEKAALAEAEGAAGFVLQEYIPCNGRSLRVVIIEDQLYSYWRVQEDRTRFLTNLRAGAVIDHEAEPELQKMGRTAVLEFCRKSGLNLAGLDLLFEDGKAPTPMFLEINYFFGRRGLGGSLHYYRLVEHAVRSWLGNIGLSL